MKKGQKKGEALNLIGNIYGKLTVIRLLGRNERKRYVWACQCDCGGIKNVPQDLLQSGRTKSCGCLIGPARLAANKYPDREKALYNLLYFSLKKRHLSKSNEKMISKEKFITLSQEPCFYCGDIASSVRKDIRRDSRKGVVKISTVSETRIEFNGIDRKDSGIGYIDGNCVSCCKHCNTAKNVMSLDKFKEHVLKIYEHWAKF